MNFQDIKEDLVLMRFLEGLTRTYEDVALERMQKIRQQVLITREFLDGVARVYSLAKSSYLKSVSQVSNKKEREKELSFITRNHRTCAILISGNQSFLGNIVLACFREFLKIATQSDTDLVVLGRIGKYLADSSLPKLNFTYFELDDYDLKEDQITAALDYISRYERIIVVYPRFQSVLQQVPTIDDVSGGVRVTYDLAPKRSYLFEPSPLEVMKYFESQVISGLFRQKILETMLSRLAARLSAMDHASSTAGKYIKALEKQEKSYKKRKEMERLLDTFSGISLWENG
jgi:ATP synthase F1 gamma subunit